MEVLLLIFLIVINFLFAKAIFNLGYRLGHYDGHKHEQEKTENPYRKKRGCKNHKWKRLESGELECEECGTGIRV